MIRVMGSFFFFSSRRRHTRSYGDWSSDVCSSDLAYERREEELGSEAMRQLERQVLLAVIDRKWREHLYEMDYLQEGVGLRAYAQRDPLVEYQREGFDMFAQMLEGIKEEAVGFLFNLKVQVEEALAPEAIGTGSVPLPDGRAYVDINAKGVG